MGLETARFGEIQHTRTVPDFVPEGGGTLERRYTFSVKPPLDDGVAVQRRGVSAPFHKDSAGVCRAHDEDIEPVCRRIE